MRSRENLRHRIRQSLKKPALKKQADFQDESCSPCYDIQMEWMGHPRLFRMHYEDPSFPVSSAELKQVFIADDSRDEWVDDSLAVLQVARASQGLMGELHRRVGLLEQSRVAADVIPEPDLDIDNEDGAAEEL